MNGEMTFFEAPVRRSRVERDAMREASDILKRRGNLILMITTFLLCLLITFTWFSVVQLLGLLLELVFPLVSLPQAQKAFEGLWLMLSALTFLAGVMPAWLGRLRLAGLLCTGDHPMAREALYYYTSPRRWGRAILIGLFLAFEVMLPAVLSLGAFAGVLALYNEVFLFYLPEALAVLLLLGGFLMALALSAAIFLLGGLYLLFAAIAVGNESMPVWSTFTAALRFGKKNLIATFLFSLRSLWHLVLSLCSFGVLLVFWYAHHYTLSYLRLSMVLTKGEDPS